MSTILLKRIAEGEGLHLDFKYAVTDSKKIARSLAAFANTSGGSLLLGVKDNGRIAGVNSDEEYYMIETAAQLYCKPEVPFSVIRWDVGGKVVLEIVIEESSKKPHTAPDKDMKPTTYIRVADENMKVGRLHSLYLKQSCGKLRPVNLGDRHQKVIDFLTENGPSSFTRIWKKLLLSTKEAERIVLDLLAIDTLTIKSTHDGSLISINSDEDQ